MAEHRPEPSPLTPPTPLPCRPPGSVAFAAQSAGFGLPGLEAAAARGVGLSSFVVLSARRPTSPATTSSSTGRTTRDRAVVLLYLDSFGNPRRSGGSRGGSPPAKPIVAMKGVGRPAARRRPRAPVRRAAGGLGRDDRRSVRTRRRDAGRHDGGDASTSRSCWRASRLPPGDRVAVLTNAGGPGVARVVPVRRPGCASSGARRSCGRSSPAAPGRDLDRQPGRHDRVGDPRVRAVASLPARARRGRRGRHDLRAAAGRMGDGGRPGIAVAARGSDQPSSPSGSGRRAGATDTGSVPASPRQRRRCGASPMPSGTRGGGRRRPTRRSNRPTPIPPRPPRPSPRAWGKGEAGWREETSSACCAAGASG